MKPARIHVFDGLRVATEHLEHLQDGIHSSIEDLRAAVGLGRIVEGLEVQRQGATGVEVQPGFAFDRRRNRVVVDEPRRVEVAFAPGQDRRYVCARYERVEDGEVEGRPTLVWDSASVVLSDTPPAADDELVPLAALVRSGDDAAPAFEIVGVEEVEPAAAEPAPGEDAPPAGEGETPEPAAEGEPGAPSEPAAEAPAAPEPAPEAPEPAPEPPAPTPTPAEPAAAEPAPADVPPPATAPEPVAPRLRQGIVDLSGGAGAGGFASLVEALRARLRDGGEGDVRVLLGRGDLEPGFAVAGLRGETSLTAEVRSAEQPAWRGWATAHGEATFGEAAVAQFGLSTASSRWVTDANGTAPSWHAPDLTDAGLAQLPLPAAPSGSDAGADGPKLALTVEAVPAPPGFALACFLVWSGDADDERIRALETATPGFTWSARIGWKAVGAS